MKQFDNTSGKTQDELDAEFIIEVRMCRQRWTVDLRDAIADDIRKMRAGIPLRENEYVRARKEMRAIE